MNHSTDSYAIPLADAITELAQLRRENRVSWLVAYILKQSYKEQGRRAVFSQSTISC